MRGSRVQAVVNELQGERIDIIPWTEDAASFIVNALQPAEVTKVVLDQDENRKGFQNMEEVGYVELTELSSIEGFDEETAQELQERAREYLQKVADEQDAERKAAGVA